MLNISAEKVCFIVVKAHEFSAKVDVVEPDPASNATDDGMAGVLEDYADDPTFAEITAFINALNEDEQIDLVTLARMGRDDFGKGEWGGARDEAARQHNDFTANYLLGMPLLASYLEDGLSKFDLSCEEFEMGHL